MEVAAAIVVASSGRDRPGSAMPAQLQFGDAMSSGVCAICRAADAPVRIIDLDGVCRAATVCEACIRIDPTQLAVLLQQRFEDAADGP